MHVEVQPRRLEPTPGVPETVTVTISNTGTVIAGYSLRVLGADPTWVQVAEPEVSLFPDETRALSVELQVPPGIAAGERRFSIQVRELTPPESSVLETVVFTVPEARSVQLRVDPMAQSAGRSAQFNLLVENNGNTAVTSRLHGQDAEGRTRFRFEPATVALQPGEHAVVDLRARARRPLSGPPVVRLLDLHLLDPGTELKPPPPAKDERSLERPQRRRPPAPQVPDGTNPLATATFLQRSILSRGLLSLAGLLVAISVFALVITLAFSQIVGQSAADRNLALEIAAANDGGESQSGSAKLSGTVRLLTSGAPVPRVEVTVYAADDTEAPLATTATTANGTWSLGELPSGDYKLKFRGSGFIQTWYPRALESADAEAVSLEAGAQRPGLDVVLGGAPATVSGKVVGEDVSAATLTLKAPQGATAATADPGAAATDGAVVKSVPIGDDGTFELTDVPSPSVYDLVVDKAGYATSAQRIDVGAGEERSGVEITLRKGDGLISGAVSSVSGDPVAEATVTVSSGQTVVATMSLTDGAEEGTFAVRGLPTPASFSVVVAKDGYRSQTLTLTLAEGQSLTGVAVTLNDSAGELVGDVTLAGDDAPVAGAMVTVTSGDQTVQTATGADGAWRAGGLAVPGTYTVTFGRGDLAAQTVSVGLDQAGGVVDRQGGTVAGGRVKTRLSSSTAIVHGRVVTQSRAPAPEATIQLISSSATYTVTSASLPSGKRGRFRVEGIAPGTYTLSVSRDNISPTSRIIQLAAGAVQNVGDVRLKAPARVRGTVRVGTQAAQGWVVELYRSAEYPRVVYRTETTNTIGGFDFGNVDAPATYVVVVRRTADGPTVRTENIAVAASADRNVEIAVSEND